MNSRPVLIILIILGLGGLVGLAWVNYRFSIENPGGGDFLPRWIGTRLFLTQGLNPYGEKATLEIQNLYYGRPANADEDPQLFYYPLYSILFFGPFALIKNYALARALWMTLLELSLLILAVLSLKLSNWRLTVVKLSLVLAFSLLWYPGFRNIINGQFAALDSLFIIGALLLIYRKEDTGAGILLALSTIEPQMVVLIIPFILLWSLSVRRYQIIFGTLGGIAVLMVFSLVLLPSWPVDILRQLLSNPSYTVRIKSIPSIIANTVPGINRPLDLFINVVICAYLLFEWVISWAKNERWFIWTALLTLVVTNILLVRTSSAQYVVMLPILFLLSRVWEDRLGRIGQILTWLLFIGITIGLWGLFITTAPGNLEPTIMYLPLPVICLLGLWWARWWAIHPPRVLVDEFATFRE